MMKWIRFWIAGLMIILVACTTAVPSPNTTVANATITPTAGTAVLANEEPATDEEPAMADLPDLGIAPEIRNERWVNADAPVTLAASQGKVVLLEFWTFG